MDTRLFLSVAEFKKLGYTNTNVNDNIITKTIIRVQDVELRSILGTVFYNHLKDAMYAIPSTLTAEERTLIDDYINPFLVTATDYRIVIPILTEIRAKGIGTTNDGDTTTATDSQVSRLENSNDMDSKTYKHLLKCYLEDNCDKFPLHHKHNCKCGKAEPFSKGYAQNISFI